MQIFFYIITFLFAIFGVGILNTAYQTKFRSFGLILGGFCYFGAAISSYILNSWWPFLIGFGLAILFRYIFGDDTN